jgi:hypothetical protein
MSNAELQSVQGILKSQFDPSTLSGSFVALNGTGFADNAKIMKMFNGSLTVSIDLSFDGVNPHDFIPPQGTVIIDFQTNHADGPIYGTGTWVVRQNQIIYGRTATQPTWLQIIGYR